MTNKTIAILTPTYNRSYILNTLYMSLMNQTNFDFVWYIVDDGSTDDTREQVQKFNQDKFQIVYLVKENGGKHTALNFALKEIQEELTFIVDSDDYLFNDAVQIILDDWGKYKGTPQLVGLSYYKMFPDNKVVGMKYKENVATIGTTIDIRVNGRIKGDKAEIYLTDVLRNNPFPEYKNEKFLSEAIIWNLIASKGYKLVFIPRGIYFCEYLQDGLTQQGRNKQLCSPLGTYDHAKSHLYKNIKLSIRIKYMIMLIAITRIAQKTYYTGFREVKGNRLLFVICFLPGFFLGLKWRRFLKGEKN